MVCWWFFFVIILGISILNSPLNWSLLLLCRHKESLAGTFDNLTRPQLKLQLFGKNVTESRDSRAIPNFIVPLFTPKASTMSVHAPTAELRDAAVEVLLEVVNARLPEAKLASMLATLRPLVETMNEVCHKVKKLEEDKEVADSIIAGKGAFASPLSEEGLKMCLANKETEMYLFEVFENRRTENELLQKQNQALKEKVRDLEYARTLQNAKMKKLQKDNSELQRQLDLEGDSLRWRDALVDDLSERCTKAEAVIVSRNATITGKDVELALVKSRRQTAKSTIDGHNREIVRLHRWIADHKEKTGDGGKEEIVRLQNWIATYFCKMADYEERLEKKDAVIAEQAEQVASQKEALEKAMSEFRDSERLMRKVADKMDEYKTGLKDANQRIEDLEYELEQLEDTAVDLDAAHDRLSRTEGELRTARRELDRLHRLRARDVASCSSCHDRRWAESDDEDDEASVEDVMGAVDTLLQQSFTRAQAGWGH